MNDKPDTPDRQNAYGPRVFQFTQGHMGIFLTVASIFFAAMVFAFSVIYNTLDSLDRRMLSLETRFSDLSVRVARIEGTLGIVNVDSIDEGDSSEPEPAAPPVAQQ